MGLKLAVECEEQQLSGGQGLGRIYGNSSKSGTNMAQKHGEILIFMEPHHKSPVSTDDSFKLSVLV